LEVKRTFREHRERADLTKTTLSGHSLLAPGWWFTSESADPDEIVPQCGVFAAGSAREAV
jgi:hypothetical protein